MGLPRHTSPLGRVTSSVSLSISSNIELPDVSPGGREGGESFVVKLKRTREGTPSSMVIDDEDGWRYLMLVVHRQPLISVMRGTNHLYLYIQSIM